jgi:hypothetical protein
MSGILNTGLSFWQFVGVIATFVATFIAIKVSLSFDVNKYLDSRKKAYMVKLRNACTHVDFVKAHGNIVVRTLFVSPPGTVQWQCQRCGVAKFMQDGELESYRDYYVENPDEYRKREKRFLKLAKKAGII